MRTHSGAGTTRRQHGRKRPATLALATVAALSAAALSACGSSSAASGSTVTIGVPGNIFDLPLQVAQAKGYFTQEGIKVKFVTITAATGTSALRSGSIDFLHSSPTSFVAALGKNLPQQAVGADAIGNPLGIVVSTSFAKKHGLTADSSSADVAKALTGSTAGVSSTNTQAEAGIYLKNEGLDPTKDVNWVTLPSPAADQAALKSGQIDWFITSEPLPYQVESDGDGVVVVGAKDVEQWAKGGYSEFVVANKSYLKSNSATATKFMTAVQKATDYVRTHTDSADLLKIATTAYPTFSTKALQSSIGEVDWPQTAAMNADEWKATMNFLGQLGSLTDPNAVTTDDWTNSYLS